MQFDLLQNDLFSADISQPSESKKKPASDVKIAEDAPLPPLPESILSAMRQPADAVFSDSDTESHELFEDEIALHQKSPNAFKTISEASQLLDVPQHVLRFWESRFSQIKPIKSRGGRRYYRPEDMKILGTIKDLLYKQGYTIKGAKKAFALLKKADVVDAPVAQVAARTLDLDQVLSQIPPRDSLSVNQISMLSALKEELLVLQNTLKMHM